MANKGYFYLERKLFEDELWEEKRAKTKFEAWIDLIQSAFYSNQTVIMGHSTVLIERGSLPFSLRGLGLRWGWSKNKVKAFLDYLLKRDSVSLKIGTPFPVLKLNNYQALQDKASQKKDRVSPDFGTASGHLRDTPPSRPLTDKPHKSRKKGKVKKSDLYKLK